MSTALKDSVRLWADVHEMLAKDEIKDGDLKELKYTLSVLGDMESELGHYAAEHGIRYAVERELYPWREDHKKDGKDAGVFYVWFHKGELTKRGIDDVHPPSDLPDADFEGLDKGPAVNPDEYKECHGSQLWFSTCQQAFERLGVTISK
jgi:hypothetical protein